MGRNRKTAVVETPPPPPAQPPNMNIDVPKDQHIRWGRIRNLKYAIRSRIRLGRLDEPFDRHLWELSLMCSGKQWDTAMKQFEAVADQYAGQPNG